MNKINQTSDLKAAYKRYEKAAIEDLDRQFKALASMKKAELLDHAFQLTAENTKLELRLAFMETRGELKIEKSYTALEKSYTALIENMSKHRRGAIVTKQRNDEFWDKWKARYHELRNSGYKIMDARRKVQKEIVGSGGKKYVLDGALKKQLKE